MGRDWIAGDQSDDHGGGKLILAGCAGLLLVLPLIVRRNSSRRL